MAQRFFLLNNDSEVGLYKAPAQLTARILNESLETNVEVFESFDEAKQAADIVFDRYLYECRKWGLPTDEVERFLRDMEQRGEDAVPSYEG
ncbi:MAG: hypothetical protein AAF495_24345 [Pseudomonadota bacterium]